VKAPGRASRSRAAAGWTGRHPGASVTAVESLPGWRDLAVSRLSWL